MSENGFETFTYKNVNPQRKLKTKDTDSKAPDKKLGNLQKKYSKQEYISFTTTINPNTAYISSI